MVGLRLLSTQAVGGKQARFNALEIAVLALSVRGAGADAARDTPPPHVPPDWQRSVDNGLCKNSNCLIIAAA
jgi:hypothetical protein